MPTQTSIAPWLSVSDAAKAVEYYKSAFGAVEAYVLESEDGGVAVAHMTLGDGGFWLQEDADSSAGSSAAGSVRLIVTTEDPDSLFDQAVAAGAKQVLPVSEEHGWRTGRVTDPFGHDWELAKPLAGVDRLR
jgi:PhnB protein